MCGPSPDDLIEKSEIQPSYLYSENKMEEEGIRGPEHELVLIRRFSQLSPDSST